MAGAEPAAESGESSNSNRRSTLANPSGWPGRVGDNGSPAVRMRIAIFENLANSAYIQAKAFRALGVEADLVLDPLDRYVMSDPRWRTSTWSCPQISSSTLSCPSTNYRTGCASGPGTLSGEQRPVPGRLQRIAALVGGAMSEPGATRTALGRARLARGATRGRTAWIVKTLSGYDCVVAYGMGPAWAALARVPCLAETWGGDITMPPSTTQATGRDTGPSASRARGRAVRAGEAATAGLRPRGADPVDRPPIHPLRRTSGTRREVAAVRIPDRRREVQPTPGARAPRGTAARNSGGPMVFVPARQDWYWKGSTGYCAALPRRRPPTPAPRWYAPAGAPTSIDRARWWRNWGSAIACGCSRARCPRSGSSPLLRCRHRRRPVHRRLLWRQRIGGDGL